MRCDWDIIREILMCLEEDETSKGVHYYSKDHELEYMMKIKHHVNLLMDEKYVLGAIGLDHVHTNRLTLRGYELLRNITDDTVWKKIKNLVLGRAVSLTLNSIKIAAPIVIEELLR